MKEFIAELCKLGFLLVFAAAWFSSIYIRGVVEFKMYEYNVLVIVVESVALVIATVACVYRAWLLRP